MGTGGGSIEFLFRIIIVPRGRSHVKIGMAWKYLFSMDSKGEDFGERREDVREEACFLFAPVFALHSEDNRRG